MASLAAQAQKAVLQAIQVVLKLLLHVLGQCMTLRCQQNKRASGASGKVTFVWWAEPGTAELGKDFMSLDKKTETLGNGEREITVFVPLVVGSVELRRAQFLCAAVVPDESASVKNATRAPMSGRMRSSRCRNPTLTLTVALARSAVGMSATTLPAMLHSG